MKTILLKESFNSPRIRSCLSEIETAVISLPSYLLYKRKNIVFQINGIYTVVEISSIQMIKKLGNKSMITCLGKSSIETPYPISFWKEALQSFDFFEFTSGQLVNKLNVLKLNKKTKRVPQTSPMTLKMLL